MHIGAELENGRKNAARRIHKGRRDRGTGLDQSRVSLVLRFFFSSLFHSLFLPLPPHWFPTIGTRSVLARAHGPCWIAITRIAPATRNACANRVFHDAPRSTEERRFHAIAADKNRSDGSKYHDLESRLSFNVHRFPRFPRFVNAMASPWRCSMLNETMQKRERAFDHGLVFIYSFIGESSIVETRDGSKMRAKFDLGVNRPSVLTYRLTSLVTSFRISFQHVRYVVSVYW